MFIEANRPPDVAVQLDDVAATGPLVQAIYILGDQSKLRQPLFEFSQSQVAGIGFCLGDQLPAPFVPLPHQAWIALKGRGRGQLLGVVLGPQAGLGFPKGGDAAFDRLFHLALRHP